MSVWRNFVKRLKVRYGDWLIARHHGQSHPDWVALPGTSQRIAIDPHDPRARKILLAGPLRGRVPRNQVFWREACRALSPTVAIDIGLNFGECLFGSEGSEGPEACRMIGFEANPRLAPFLERSRHAHPLKDRMELHFGLVSDLPGLQLPFHIDTQWSGGSTAVDGSHPESTGRYETVMLPTLTVDESVGPLTTSDKLLFKLDVEGYEARVIKGMRQVLRAPRWAIGLIEFDSALLKKSGENLADYWRQLERLFEGLYMFPKQGPAQPVERFDRLMNQLRGGDLHTDLLAVRGDLSELARFLTRWVRQPTASRMAG